MSEREQVMQRLVVQAYMAEYLTSPGQTQTAALTAIWSRALNPVPTERLEELFYDAMEYDPKRVPRQHDVLAAWQRYLMQQPAKTFQQQEAAKRPKLPSDSIGPGRVAWLAIGARDKAGKGNILCHCSSKKGGFETARISEDGLWWTCRTAKCHFKWPVADTMNAPVGSKAGPLADALYDSKDGGSNSIGDGQPEFNPSSLSGDELLLAFKTKCRFEHGKLARQAALDFVTYAIKQVQWADLNENVARELWSEWKGSHPKAA